MYFPGLLGVSRDHGLWWKVKQEVTRSLGKQWSLLAQACNINREDIKEIMNLYPDDLPEQISQMFYLIEERKDYSTVCSLMMCLRKAAMNSTHANQLHFRNLAESVFVIAVTCKFQYSKIIVHSVMTCSLYILSLLNLLSCCKMGMIILCSKLWPSIKVLL